MRLCHNPFARPVCDITASMSDLINCPIICIMCELADIAGYTTLKIVDIDYR